MPHYYRTKTLLNLLGAFKQLKTHHEKKTFKNMLHGLHQNGIFPDDKHLSHKFA